jgi:STE24 endopeptidase
MTTMSAHLPVSASRRRVGHFGAWRAMAAVPSMVASLLLMVVLLGLLGRWEGLALLGWLISGVAVLTRVGERAAVRVGCGFHRPNAGQAVLLAPVWATALERCAIAASEVDLYVQRRCEANAYATGGRSVAVTTGVLSEFQAGRLSGEHLAAVLVHELGHHATRATRLALVTIWLAAPWRLTTSIFIGIARALSRRQPPRALAAVIVIGIVVAIVHAVQARQWSVAFVLTGVTVAAALCPVADAALSRRTEFAADRYATGVGVGAALASALQILGRGQLRRPGLASRLLSRHPTSARRIAALSRASIADRRDIALPREQPASPPP